MCYIYATEYYSAVKKKIRKFAGKWMELEKKIILSEVTQTQKDKHGMYSLISATSYKVKTITYSPQTQRRQGGLKAGTGISLGKGNRTDFTGGLGADDVGNRKDQVGRR